MEIVGQHNSVRSPPPHPLQDQQKAVKLLTADPLHVDRQRPPPEDQ